MPADTLTIAGSVCVLLFFATAVPGLHQAQKAA